MLKIRNIVRGSRVYLSVTYRVAGFIAAVVLSLVLLSNPAVSETTQRIKPTKVSGQTQTFEIPSWGNEVPPLLMELPTGFVLAGIDFDVYVATAKSRAWGARMGIYVGLHPDSTWPQSSSNEPGAVGAIPITWHVWRVSDHGRTLYHRDVLIENFFAEPRQEVAPISKVPSEYRLPVPPPHPALPDSRNSLTIQVSVSGNSSEAVKTMAGWVVTLRKKR